MKVKHLTRIFFIITILVSLASSCNQGSQRTKNETEGNIQSIHAVSLVQFITPKNGTILKTTDILELQVSMADSLTPDSIQFKMEEKRLGMIPDSKSTFQWKINHVKVGTQSVQAIAFFKNGKKALTQVQISIFPEKAISYTYVVNKTYSHDKEAYTQGLLYDEGVLYEGTGLDGKSSLRKEKITGEILNALSLPANVFGEGIATFDDKIIQITWQSQVAFVFEKSSFKQIMKLNYPMKEGWGITYNGENLLMSDGSSTIYFLDKHDMTEISRLEVCDDQGPVINLNELEYIEGQIWANVYMTDQIVRINPATGAVVGKIDMTGLLKPADKEANTNVLNGIAFDPKTKHIYVTGKNWPKLFEISVIQKH